MKAYVDKDECIGCGVCPTVCPEVFEMGGNDVAVVIGDTVPPEAEESAKSAEEQCPTEAIKVE